MKEFNGIHIVPILPPLAFFVSTSFLRVSFKKRSALLRRAPKPVYGWRPQLNANVAFSLATRKWRRFHCEIWISHRFFSQKKCHVKKWTWGSSFMFNRRPFIKAFLMEGRAFSSPSSPSDVPRMQLTCQHHRCTSHQDYTRHAAFVRSYRVFQGILAHPGPVVRWHSEILNGFHLVSPSEGLNYSFGAWAFWDWFFCDSLMVVVYCNPAVLLGLNEPPFLSGRLPPTRRIRPMKIVCEYWILRPAGEPCIMSFQVLLQDEAALLCDTLVKAWAMMMYHSNQT